MRKADAFDKQKVYTEKIQPLVRELLLACHEEEMPMFVTVVTKNNKKETVYESNALYAALNKSLEDDRIPSILLYFKKFKTKQPKYVQEAIRTLQDYLDNQSERFNSRKRVDVRLKDDKLPGIAEIAETGAEVEIPLRRKNRIDSDYWED